MTPGPPRAGAWALLPAAGSGRRFGGEVPKQYLAAAGKPLVEHALGALLSHITGDAEAATFQPMNVNFGLFPPVEAKGGRRGRKDRYPAYTERAKQDFTAWLATA